MACRFSIGKRCHAGETRWATSVLRALALFLSGAAFLCFNARAQKQPEEAWQAQVRKYSDAHDWTNALRIVDEQITSSPQDMDILAWRARVLTWAGRLAEAERDFNTVLKVEKNDPDNWMGLANLYMRQGHTEEALKAADRAVELDPNRGDLRSARAQILRASGSLSDARLEFRRALVLDPGDVDARAGIFSLRDEGKQGFTGSNPIPRVCEHVLRLSASLGISIFPDDAGDATGLIARADAAMHVSKRRR